MVNLPLPFVAFPSFASRCGARAALSSCLPPTGSLTRTARESASKEVPMAFMAGIPKRKGRHHLASTWLALGHVAPSLALSARRDCLVKLRRECFSPNSATVALRRAPRCRPPHVSQRKYLIPLG